MQLDVNLGMNSRWVAIAWGRGHVQEQRFRLYSKTDALKNKRSEGGKPPNAAVMCGGGGLPPPRRMLRGGLPPNTVAVHGGGLPPQCRRTWGGSPPPSRTDHASPQAVQSIYLMYVF